MKEITIPVDLKLHSDVRAVDRAEFDNQVLPPSSLILIFYNAVDNLVLGIILIPCHRRVNNLEFSFVEDVKENGIKI